MQYDDFVGTVQHRAKLASSGEAVRAIHAVLETLGERLYGGAPENLAAQLPQEIGTYLTMAEKDETFDVEEFFDRVAARENVDRPDAVHHIRSVFSVVTEAVTPAEMIKVLEQLPDEYEPLFDSSSQGNLEMD